MANIDIVKSFHRVNSFPLDDSLVFASTADIDAHIASGLAYEGQIVYCKFDKKIYKLDLVSSVLTRVEFVAGGTDTYPTALSWTNGTTAGPVGNLSGNTGFTSFSFPSVPLATASQSGVISTTAQSFAGEKTFNDGLVTNTLNSTASNQPISIGSNLSTGGAVNILTNAGISASSVTIGSINSTTTINGSLVVAGTTTTVNSTTVSIADKNIDLAAVSTPSNISVQASNGSNIITMSTGGTTAGFIVGQAVTQSDGLFNVIPSGSTILAILSTSQFRITNIALSSATLNINIGGATDVTANGGGITVKGSTDKTILFNNANSNWELSENINIPTGKVYKINNTTVLTSNQVLGKTLGGTATGDIVTIDASQSLTNKKLGSLTTNGFVTTYNGDGSLSITSPPSGSSILYGNGSGGFNNVTVGSGLSFTSGTLTASGIGGSNFNTQAANTIFAGPTTGANQTPTFRNLVENDIPTLSLTKLANITGPTILGASTSGAQSVGQLSPTTVTGMLNTFSLTAKGLVPAPGTSTGLFLKDDGTWAAASGTAGVTSFSGGSTGLLPNTGTTGAVTLTGTLAIASGGTGQTTQQLAINALAGAVTSGQYLRGNGTNVVMSSIQAGDIPTLNQNTTGTAANVTGTVAIANGGTGQTTQQLAINALAGAVTSGQYLRGNGTNIQMSAIQASDIPTLNQNTTGTASNVTGIVAITNGGTGQTSQQSAINSLAGAVTSGQYLRGNGTNVQMSSIQAGDIPTLNQNTTGTASNVTGIVAIANGGTGQSTQQLALNAIAGATTSGQYLRGNGTNVTLSAIQASDVPTLNQDTTGNAAKVTVSVDNASVSTFYPAFATTSTAGSQSLSMATTKLKFTPSSGTLEATVLKITGGTGSQFLKADGSTDSNSYMLSSQTVTMTGDVTATAQSLGSVSTSIASGAVTLSKMASLAANSIIGNNTATSSTPAALSATQVTAMLNTFGLTTKGLVPAPGTSTGLFLKDDGSWAAPASGGGGITSLNALTGSTQTFATGSTGNDFTINSSGTTHTFNIPTASSTVRGLLSSGDWATFNGKQAALTFGNLSESTSSVLTITGGTGAVIGSGTTIQVKQASSSQSGFLSSTDWGTFNNKGNGTVTSVAALTLGTTGTDLTSTVATGTSTPVITLNVPTASATNRGALSAADWITFNNKQGALTLTTTGSSGAATLVGNTLNIPQYSGGGGGGTPTVSPSITAGADTQGITTLTSNINVITTTNTYPYSAVTLQSATAGLSVTVVNRGTVPLKVYPASGASIDSLASNAAIVVPVNQSVDLNAYSTTQWKSSLTEVTGNGRTLRSLLAPSRDIDVTTAPTAAGTTITFTTPFAHGMIVGETVSTYGFGGTGYNLTRVKIATAAATTFTVTAPVAPTGTPGTTGKIKNGGWYSGIAVNAWTGSTQPLGGAASTVFRIGSLVTFPEDCDLEAYAFNLNIAGGTGYTYRSALYEMRPDSLEGDLVPNSSQATGATAVGINAVQYASYPSVKAGKLYAFVVWTNSFQTTGTATVPTFSVAQYAEVYTAYGSFSGSTLLIGPTNVGATFYLSGGTTAISTAPSLLSGLTTTTGVNWLTNGANWTTRNLMSYFKIACR